MKHLYKNMIFFFVLCSAFAANGSPRWHIDGLNEGWKDEFFALQYFHNSEMQRQWAWHLLSKYRFRGNERVLDFGCGDGKITAETSHFLPDGQIVGIDASPAMIAFASRCFPNQYYSNLQFAQTEENGCDFIKEKERYDLICSFCVLHLVPDPVEILQRLHSFLRPDGVLYLVIPAGNNPAFFQAATETFHKYTLPVPWLAQQKTSNNTTMRTQEGCIDCLDRAGFQPVSITLLHTPTLFFNKQELVEWMVGTVAPNWHVAFDQADLFFHDLIDRMAELDEDVIGRAGTYQMKLSRLEVIAMPKRVLF